MAAAPGYSYSYSDQEWRAILHEMLPNIRLRQDIRFTKRKATILTLALELRDLRRQASLRQLAPRESAVARHLTNALQGSDPEVHLQQLCF